MSSSSKSLFDRKYDAVGFWGHLQDVTGTLWSRIPGILRAGAGFNDAAAFNAAVKADTVEVMDS